MVHISQKSAFNYISPNHNFYNFKNYNVYLFIMDQFQKYSIFSKITLKTFQNPKYGSNDATHQIVNHDYNDIIYRYDNPSNIKISEFK